MFQDVQKTKINSFALFLALFFVFFKLDNLNYISPYLNDESVYVIIGKMGLFENDWETYDAESWIQSNQYFYPSVSALAYTLGGMEGTRALSVIFTAIATIAAAITSYALIPERYDKNIRIFGGLTSALLLAISVSSYYVARIAIVDAQSFMFLSLSTMYFTLALNTSKNSSSNFFMAAVTIYLAYLTKIFIVPYIILFQIIGFFYLWAKKNDQLRVSLIYFFLPLTFAMIIYEFIHFSGFVSYLTLLSDGSSMDIHKTYEAFVVQLMPILPFALFGLLGLFIGKHVKSIIFLILLTLPMPLNHLLVHIETSTNTHAFVPYMFLSIVSGTGLAVYLSAVKNVWLNNAVRTVLLIGMVLLGYFYLMHYKIESDYFIDTTNLREFVSVSAKLDDKILTEVGTQIVLAAYNKTSPGNSYTYDWFEYNGISGPKAYGMAVKDGYFDIIQINGNWFTRRPIYQQISDNVLSNLDEKYELKYKEENFYVYIRSERDAK